MSEPSRESVERRANNGSLRSAGSPRSPGEPVVRARRSWCPLAVLLAVALAWAASPAMARVLPRKLCSKYRCTTIAADSKVQVYKATSRHPGRETYAATFARWLPNGRVTSLGEFAGEVRMSGSSWNFGGGPHGLMVKR
jgi:hypothetical protein